MGTWYEVVNWTRRERLGKLPALKYGELLSSTVAAAIVNAYLLERRGDWVAYVGDDDGSWPFPSGSLADLVDYPDVTDAIIDFLIEGGVLADDGRNYQFPDDPDPEFANLYTRILRHIGEGPNLQW